MPILYSIFIRLMVFGMKVFSCFNEKARKGIMGRKKSLKIVQEKLAGQQVIWMHAASLGEYEQGLPVLEKLKEKYPEHKVLVTFFSPSGYENVVKKQHFADAVCYLPFDKKSDIREFISQFKTEIFFTIKYDFWYHLFEELKKQNAKIFVVSALFYERQIFFKPYGKWLVKQLQKNVDWFFHQTENSEKLARQIGLNQSLVSGDTRFDRVKQLRERDNFVPFIEEFKGENQLVVFGSSWEAEEKIAKIIAEKSPQTKIIIAPHDIKRNLKFEVQNLKFSELKDKPQISNSQILIIDCIGLLSKIYSYADIAVVGGGFHSAGLHNILEAATFGKPVIFGNHYRKNPEADNLIANNGGKSFEDEEVASEFILTLLNDEKLHSEMSQNAKKFVENQPNATEVILRKI
ncbi:MAG: glycosyltransferase N-terminal domain-containing protein [Flavobacteriaceae bacterium]|nr:glycosyltransferase N-terminal domain-containing protein [Flavobacteriaceae bacterium]